MRVAFTIAAEDLRRLLRAPVVLLASVLGPLALGAVLAIAVGNAGSRLEIGVVDLDGSPASTRLVDGLTGDRDGPLVVTRFDAEATAVQAVEDGRVRAVLVLAAGFGAAEGGPTVRVVGDRRAAFSAEAARSVAEQVLARTALVRARVVATVAAAPGTPVDSELLDAAAAAPPAVDLVVEERGRAVNGPLYFGPATVFLFFTVGTVARGLLSEERLGTLVRLRAAPVSAGELVAGKGLAAWLQGMISLVGVWALSTLAFGARWGPAARVLVVLALVAAAAAGVALLVASAARTPQQAQAWNSLVTFTFALVGGSFVAPGSLPPVLQRVGRLTPNGLGLTALGEAGGSSRSLLMWSGPLPALALMALVTGALASWAWSRRWLR